MTPETVLITGCSSGIGRATALEFVEEDWCVYATARNPADIETLGEAGCRIATLDVTDPDDVERVVGRIVDEEGHLSCLVNNAGYAQFGPVEDVPTGQVHRQFDVNLYGPHRLLRAALPHMREQEAGTVVNVSSAAGRLSFPGGGIYAGSKFALEAMSDALRNEVDEYGIDVVLIEPGPVETSFTERAEAEVYGGSADNGEADGDGETVDGGDTDDIAGLDRSGAYDSFYDLFSDTQLVGGGGLGAISPERVAEDIVDAASSTKPKARYQPGTAARVGALARFLPSRWLDAGYRYLRKL
ncbi:short-chain dehydrogenase/reductase [Halobellus salinus]|uniref:Short-chain dehydrogenase/reductase n=1 Tax=Halobellus salinus TaxID=931585 RepID=A0A830EE61_9EURY|nr:SDR family oxidoreductase [Halobellus salinus]GGJ01153.1 short-chain dehydrogenase/reductase [Halobellus salinus]SMP00657.1 Short-chain dehydrogenase [Halobellus salinus]